MAKIGQDIIMIATPTSVVAATKSHDITVNCDEIEKSSSTQSRWREYIAGRKNWELSTSWLLVSQTFKAQMLRVGSSYTITIGDSSDNTDRLTGSVICTQAHITATKGSLVQGSFRFRGTGALSAAT